MMDGAAILDAPLLSARGITHSYGARIGCRDIDFDLWPGEVLGVVGESGSGKTTLLNCLSAQMMPLSGKLTYRLRTGDQADVYALTEAERRMLMRTDWGFVHQNPRDGLRMGVSAGMQQRVQIARNLVSGPRLVFMDEPTGGLDVSVQARLLDLLRGLTNDLGLSAVIVTHDLAVARLLSHRLMVMRRGEVVEQGLTDQVLDDPQHAYTQLLVSSVLQT